DFAAAANAAQTLHAGAPAQRAARAQFFTELDELGQRYSKDHLDARLDRALTAWLATSLDRTKLPRIVEDLRSVRNALALMMSELATLADRSEDDPSKLDQLGVHRGLLSLGEFRRLLDRADQILQRSATMLGKNKPALDPVERARELLERLDSDERRLSNEER